MWLPSELTTPGGAHHITTRHSPTELHIARWKPGWILYSPDGIQICRFRLLRGAKDWVDRHGHKNPHGWDADGFHKWRREDPETVGAIFRPIIAAGLHHLHDFG